MQIYKAFDQWCKRPIDERFWTLDEMVRATHSCYVNAAQGQASYGDLSVMAEGDSMFLAGKSGVKARLSNWAFGQLCSRAGAPASYLRQLPAPMAQDCLNHGLREQVEDGNARILFHGSQPSSTAADLARDPNLLARAFTSMTYKRVWNWEIGKRLIQLRDDGGWVTPPARPAHPNDPRTRKATEADCGPHTLVQPGDLIAPSGIYASDHDTFVFMVNPERTVSDGKNELSRGFFCWNSEVGAASFGVMAFLYNHTCSNHIVWGAQGVHEIRVRHVGNADERAFNELSVELRKYADESTSDMDAKIASAKKYVIPGNDKSSVVDAIFGIARQKRVQIPQKAFRAAYDIADQREDDYGHPNTLWALTQGLTQLSQQSEFADKRVDLDRQAGKLLEIAF